VDLKTKLRSFFSWSYAKSLLKVEVVYLALALSPYWLERIPLPKIFSEILGALSISSIWFLYPLWEKEIELHWWIMSSMLVIFTVYSVVYMLKQPKWLFWVITVALCGAIFFSNYIQLGSKAL